MSSKYGQTVVKKFQRKHSLDITGKLDPETVEEMNRPRCGDPDTRQAMEHFGENEGQRPKRFELHGSKWPNRTIYWKVEKYSERPNLIGRNMEIDLVMKKALNVIRPDRNRGN